MKNLLLFSLMLLSHFSFCQSFDSLFSIQVHEVYFDSGKYELRDDTRQILDSLLIVDSLSIYNLEGHTDLVGSIESNQKLSENRVKSVSDYLIQRGVDVARISSSAMGESDPKIESNKEILENRRVTIHVGFKRSLRWISGSIVDDSTKFGITALVKMQGKNFQDSAYTDQEGHFQLAVPDKANYRMNVLADGYFFDERFIKVSRLVPVEFKVEMKKAKIGAAFTMPNFNFKGNVAVLVPRSVPTLKLLHNVMANSEVCIEIKGHINRPNAPRSEKGTSDYKLSVDRAQMVKKSMITKGVNPNRMVANGYSNWEMLYPLAKSETNQAKNRRVEIVVIDCSTVDALQK